MVVLVQYVFLAFESVNEIVWCTIQMKPLSALHFHVILFLFISILQNEISNFCLFFTLANAASRRVKETVCCSLVHFVWFFPLSINDV